MASIDIVIILSKILLMSLIHFWGMLLCYILASNMSQTFQAKLFQLNLNL